MSEYDDVVPTDLSRRARVHAALGDPARLAVVDELAASDRSPGELARRFGLPSNLLAHHLDVLEGAGVIERFVSSGDRRRRYVRLRRDVIEGLESRPSVVPTAAPLFICSRNSARSQLAAALWTDRTGQDATSAGTQPATQVHPGAVAAARRAGLDLTSATPRRLGIPAPGQLVVTVCDRAHEELVAPADWRHWSLADPVAAGTDDAFDVTIAQLDQRISAMIPTASPDRIS